VGASLFLKKKPPILPPDRAERGVRQAFYWIISISLFESKVLEQSWRQPSLNLGGLDSHPARYAELPRRDNVESKLPRVPAAATTLSPTFTMVIRRSAATSGVLRRGNRAPWIAGKELPHRSTDGRRGGGHRTPPVVHRLSADFRSVRRNRARKPDEGRRARHSLYNQRDEQWAKKADHQTWCVTPGRPRHPIDS
jgi:hypothetical protein